MEDMMAKVAFLGLGVMGYPMAGHLKNKGGHELTVYNRTTAKAEAWVKEYGGGKAAKTPAQADAGEGERGGQGIRRRQGRDAPRGGGRGPGFRHDVRRQRRRCAR